MRVVIESVPPPGIASTATQQLGAHGADVVIAVEHAGLADGQTILVIDKYVERLVKLADRHTIIERGRVAWQGRSAELDADRGLWHRYLGL